MIIQSRRGFVAGLGALFVAAPAIVRAASIMPVKAIRRPTMEEINALLRARMDEAYLITREQMSQLLYGGFAWKTVDGGSSVQYIPLQNLYLDLPQDIT